MPQRAMVHEVDPRQQIWDAVGDLSDWKVFHNGVLIGIYMRPEKTKSGIILSDQTRREDEYQGKAGMVLKKGPLAFVSDDNYDFKGQNVEPGDWVAVWVSDGKKIMVNGVLCRMVEDRYILLGIPAPDAVF